MPLTAENMETRIGVYGHSAIIRDTARMNEAQLDNYVRRSFAGQRDFDLLPWQFWDGWFNMHTHGPSPDGKSAPSPANFFSETHDIIGWTLAGASQIMDAGEEQPDFSFRPRYRRVILGILNECTITEGDPTDEQITLAGFAVEAVGVIKSIAEFNSYYKAMISERTGQKFELIPLNYPEILKDDLRKLRKDKLEMVEQAIILMNNGRFGQLELDY